MQKKTYLLQTRTLRHNSSYIRKIVSIAPAGWPQSYRCPAAQVQVSLTLSIPNYLPSRQGKSLNYEWECVFDRIVQKCRKGKAIFLIWVSFFDLLQMYLRNGS